MHIKANTLKELSLKQAHAISCNLKREIAILKASVSSMHINIYANSVNDVDVAILDKYTKVSVAYKEILALEALHCKLRSLIGEANLLPIPFLQSSTIRKLIEDQVSRKAASASLSQLAVVVGSLSEEDILNAKRLNAPNSTGSMVMRACASEEQAKAINSRIKSLMSAIVKNNLVIDKANAVMTIAITDDEFVMLESFGLA